MCVSMSSGLMIASLMGNINYTHFYIRTLYTHSTTFACILCIILEWYCNLFDWVIGKIGRSRGTSHSAFFCSMGERTQDLIYFIPLCTSKVKMNNTSRHTYQCILSFQKYKKQENFELAFSQLGDTNIVCTYMHTW